MGAKATARLAGRPPDPPPPRWAAGPSAPTVPARPTTACMTYSARRCPSNDIGAVRLSIPRAGQEGARARRARGARGAGGGIRWGTAETVGMARRWEYVYCIGGGIDIWVVGTPPAHPHLRVWFLPRAQNPHGEYDCECTRGTIHSCNQSTRFVNFCGKKTRDWHCLVE